MQHNTPSLQTSKGLKDAGFPHDKASRYYCGGHTYYYDDPKGKWEACAETELLDDEGYCESAGLTTEFTIAAPTAQELADELPVSIEHEFPNSLCVTKDTDKYWASYDHVDEDIIAASGETMAEALASLYIKLNGDSKS